MARKKSSKKSYRRRRSYKRSAKKYVPRKVRKYVKTAISRSIETKRSGLVAEQIPIYTYISDAQCNALLPVLAQGTGQGDRIGDEVRIHKTSLRFAINCDSTAANSSISKYFDIYIFKLRKANTNPTATDMQRFLQDGNSATAYDANSSVDGLRDVNQDLFRLCMHKRVKMANSNDITNQPGTQGTISFSAKIDCTKWLKKVQKYDDTSDFPTNDNLFIAIGSIWTDLPSSGLRAPQLTGHYSYLYEYEYKDA